ncbi:DUF4838 domain-containing protein [Agriterribacter sp.]|uniref:DUF4838 domain-containing protein n=1 Tax=Agriterribacter sp. TaxID=2821509 RepID=UPI002CBE67EC|nr:DUF4838 domain-containing protein [Agriterribacter sp.]HRO44782.1 DUF4838 domain-containing protein [Agriterribacter sp.]HRQ19417.1 DUF4838 domain-containing protein [Agriterribacter sp.]
MKQLFQLTFLLLLCNTMVAQKVTLIKKGKSPYSIVMPAKATLVEIQAAKVLQDYLFRITGVSLPVVADNEKSTASEILIGRVNRPEQDQIDYSQLKQDGLLIKTSGNKLILTGGDKKGVIYSVYTFLDKYLGCRKYTSDFTYVPQRKKIVLQPINDIQLPAFRFRETYYNDVYDPEFMDWHKLHSFEGRGGDKTQWGYWVHTFNSLLDPREYGESHPEYFSFYNGKRHGASVPSWDGSSTQPQSQLCLTNPDVLEIVCKNLQKAIDKNPQALYWSVSQNDNVNYCRCDNCAALDKKHAAFAPEEKLLSTHGGEKYPALGMGSLLTFVNKVAERFPDKIISTLAYQYSRVPPKGIVPRKNVNIMLCSIESSRNDPMETGDKAFSEDLIGWGKLTDNILVWDYVIRFSHLFAPFPNLRVLQPNIQFLRNNNVSALFEQGNIQSGGDFAPLRAYMIAKMLWNPDLDIEKEKNEFIDAYYGPAAAGIKEYIRLLHDNNQSGKGVKMSIFGSPVQEKESFLSEKLIAEYNRIFDRAEKKVQKHPDYFVRVKSARLPVYYAMLEIAKEVKTGNRGAFVTGEDGNLIPNPKIVNILYEFAYHCARTKVSRTAEWHTPPKEYLEKYIAFLHQPPVNK